MAGRVREVAFSRPRLRILQRAKREAPGVGSKSPPGESDTVLTPSQAQEAARYPRADPASAVERPYFGVEIECIEYISESDRGYDNSLTSDESDGSEASANEILRHSADVLRDVYGDPTGPRPNNTPDGSEPESDEIDGSVTASEANQQEAKEIRDTALQRRKDWLRNAYQQLNNSEIEASITGFGP